MDRGTTVRTFATATITLLALALLPGVVLAQSYPPEQQGVTVDCSFDGQTVQCDGRNFEPNSEVEAAVEAEGEVRREDTVTANSSGTAFYDFEPVCNTDEVEVTLSGQNADGNSDSDSDVVDISSCEAAGAGGDGAGAVDDLPDTGTPFGVPLAAGLTLAGAAGLLFLRRRGFSA